MKTNKKMLWVFSMVVMLAMLITSCAPAAAPAPEQPTEAPAARRTTAAPDYSSTSRCRTHQAPEPTAAPVAEEPKILRVAYTREKDVSECLHQPDAL